MKNFILSFVLLMGAAALAAGNEDVVISFSSVGPDTYGDGTTVADGESYALVWTPNGATFGGFNADGSAVGDSKLVVRAPVAKGGKCPLVLFQIDSAYRAKEYPNGTFGVYLLDTRVFATDADGVVLKDGEGHDVVAKLDASSVKGYGAVVTSTGVQLASASSKAGVAASAASATEMKIRDIQFVDDNVYLYVQGANAGKFELSAGDKVNTLAAEGVDRASTETEAVIIRPKKSGGEFFTINRK